MLCSAEFIKQVFPRFSSPTRPSGPFTFESAAALLVLSVELDRPDVTCRGHAPAAFCVSTNTKALSEISSSSRVTVTSSEGDMIILESLQSSPPPYSAARDDPSPHSSAH
jgi:hypothetical protein